MIVSDSKNLIEVVRIDVRGGAHLPKLMATVQQVAQKLLEEPSLDARKHAKHILLQLEGSAKLPSTKN